MILRIYRFAYKMASIMAIIMITAAALVFSGCKNLLTDLPEVPSGGTQVTLTLSAGTTEPRTVTVQEEDIPTIASYVLTAVKGETTITDTYSDLTGAEITVETGTWNFTLRALDGADGTGNILLEGTLGPMEITEQGELAFALAPRVSGSGDVEVEIIWPETVPVASVSYMLDGSVEVTGTPSGPESGTYTYTVNETGLTATSGIRFIVYLKDAGGNVLMTVFERVRVYGNLTSRKTIVLSASDFNSAPAAAPSNLTAVRNGTSTTVNLSWTDNSTNEAGFKIEYSDDNGNTWSTLTTVAGGSNSYSDANTPAGMSRSYRMRAVNDFGESGYSNIVVVIPGGLVYETTGGEITITGYTGSAANLVIPAAIDGTPITSFGYRAFYRSSSLRSVIIPDLVTTIGSQAFSGCTGLTSVTIGASVTTIGQAAFGSSGLTSVTIPDSVISIDANAFSNCDSLTSVTIPASVTSIGNGAFNDCNGLTDITVAAGNPTYSSEGGVFLTQDGKTLLIYPAGKTDSSYTIPTSVETIGSNAFYSCVNLTSVAIGSSVKIISSNAFYRCSGLTSVTIPASVTSIDARAFYLCDSLTDITVDAGNSAYSSESGVLLTHDGTTLLIYPAGKTDSSYTVPASVETIGDYAFSNCDSLTSVTIPASVTSINERAFSNCAGLESMTIPSSVATIGNYAFSSCTGLTSVAIPASVTSISDGVFWGCESLTSVTIPAAVTSIGNGAFRNCTGLTSVAIPASVTSIGDYALAYCSVLTSVIVNATTPPTLGGSYVFEGNHEDRKIYVPSGSVSAYQSATYWDVYSGDIVAQ